MSTITVHTSLETVNCSCGGTYAVSKQVYDSCRERGGGWHCPYCRGGVSWGIDTENNKLKRLLANVEKEKAALAAAVEQQRQRKNEALAEADHFRRSRDGMKGVVAKIKKRVGRGVCPCCNRHFPNLQRHMETQHPEVAKGEVFDGMNAEVCQPEGEKRS